MEHRGVRHLTPGSNGIVVLKARQSRKVHIEVSGLINQLGQASSRAQGLGHVITTFTSFSNSDNTLYILLDDAGKQALGFLKVGVRNLFLWDRRGVQHEKKILCLLDFFTCPNCQRQGHGKRMIDAMLEDHQLDMRQVPIDRPSALCLRFMNKHFGLSEFVSQSNHFVVFDEFWECESDCSRPLPAIANTSPIRTNQAITNVAKAIIANPTKRTHYNPITWSIHPGIVA
jgi:alpha-tubulin N-acetyltransferase 1